MPRWFVDFLAKIFHDAADLPSTQDSSSLTSKGRSTSSWAQPHLGFKEPATRSAPLHAAIMFVSRDQERSD
jgi:hypothetical protein